MSRRRVTLRAHGLSLRADVRVLAVLGGLTVASLAVFTAHVSRGEFQIAAPDVLAALVGAGDQATSFIVLELRVPRALVAVLAGAALGVAGAIFQDLARNPLVSPDVIGISAGAALAAVAVIVLGDAAGFQVPLAAITGAVGAGILLYLLAWRGGVHGYRLVLVGIALAALFDAGVLWVLARGRIFEVAQAYVWLVGSLNGRGWEHVWPLAVVLAVLLPLALALGRALEMLQLGDEVARTLGVRIERARLGLLAVAVALTAVAVAAAGAIAFVAFIAPHIARRLGHSVSPVGVLPLSAAAGALLLLAADLAGRLLFAPTEIPAGIVTAVLAAPYFLYLLHRANRLGATG